MHSRTKAVSSFVLVALCGCSSGTTTDEPVAPPANMVVTQGIGQERLDCPPAVECTGGSNVRETFCGEITADDGSIWALAAPVSGGAEFIWTNNLDLDNLVVCRMTVDSIGGSLRSSEN